MRRVPGWLFVLVLLGAGAALAANPKVYKWTDEDGTVHYSAEPPEAGAEEVALDKAPTPPPAPVAASEPSPTQEEYARACEQHRSNLKVIEDPSKAVSIDDGGTVRKLDANGRTQQIELARASLKECEAVAAAAAALAAAAAPAATPPPADHAREDTWRGVSQRGGPRLVDSPANVQRTRCLHRHPGADRGGRLPGLALRPAVFARGAAHRVAALTARFDPG